MKKKYHSLNIAGLTRKLPIVEIEKDKLSIASFVMLGDTELNIKCAKELIKKFPNKEFDYLITPEAKAIPLVQEICHQYNFVQKRNKFKDYMVLRKSIKSYMNEPLVEEVNSITTFEKQIMVLDMKDAEKINNKNVYLIDDVFSTGNSYRAMVNLISKTNAKILFAGAILREGNFNVSDIEKKLGFPITFIGEIPLLK